MDALDLLITAIASFLTTLAGVLVYFKNRDQAKNASTRLLMGLAQDKIVHLGLKYVERGYISNQEFDDYSRYLYEPYVTLGGNGTAARIMDLVKRLPFRQAPIQTTHAADVDIIKKETNGQH